jgi:hypothetical protein
MNRRRHTDLVRSRWRAQRELRSLLRERPRFHVYFSRSQVAASLWDYAEDDLAELALTMSDSDLRNVQAIAAHYEDPSYALPVVGQRITHNHVTALAAITYFEGAIRPLVRTRRRPEKDRPARFAPSPPDPTSGL